MTTIRCSQGREGAAAVEAVEGVDRGEEAVLGDVLGRGGVVDDEVGGAVGTAPVQRVEPRHRRAGPVLGLPHESPLLRTALTWHA